MVKERKSNWWKVLIVLTFIISVICLFIIIPKPHWSYEVKYINLSENAMVYIFPEEGKVVDYLCTDNVLIEKDIGFKMYTSYFYFQYLHPGDGKCIIKIRRFEGFS